eukprot:TRINITY_DN19333_c0_g1_i1.p1 TRINITY_DN19333_c0_g1~~TRINITY_DN19333_c0_g1_i1.p1  ORF type:complete len:495 (+),score=80.19 TRINITY_DN19333_c0_g1_i1:86-1570(+)
MDIQDQSQNTTSSQPTRMLFLPECAKGHITPLMQIAEWFVNLDGFEVHVWASGRLKSYVPKGAIIHEEGCDCDRRLADLEEIFGHVSKFNDFLASTSELLNQLCDNIEKDPDIAAAQFIGAVRIAKKIEPQIVIADTHFRFGNLIPGWLANELKVPFLAIHCPGRPEGLGSYSFATYAARYGDILRRAENVYQTLLKNLIEVETGEPPEGLSCWRLLPGCRSLVSDRPAADELFIGPLLELPPKLNNAGDGNRQQGCRWLEQALENEKDLLRWMVNNESNTEAVSDLPIVYVAFGTLARTSQEMLERFAEGLKDGPWRVLWSLPKDQQIYLPETLREDCPSPRWKVCSFVPQKKVLQFENVSCFVSHCGQNSSHEALSYGVPMVCVPFFWDQFQWASSICDAKAGIQLDKFNSTSDDIRKAVTRVLEDGEIRKHARACADDMQVAARAASTNLPVSVEDGQTGIPLAATLIHHVLKEGVRIDPYAACMKCCRIL